MAEGKTTEDSLTEDSTTEDSKTEAYIAEESTAGQNEEALLVRIAKATARFILDEPQKKHLPYLIAYFSAISILELVAYNTGPGIAASIASRIWLAGGAICMAGVLLSFARAVKRDIAKKNILPLIGVLGIIIALFFICGRVDLGDVSPEASLQAAAGLNSYSAPSWGYTGIAFIGYPSRQYTLIAIPALLFGRSIATLRLGFGIPFILGILSMYGGMRRWTDRKGINGAYAAVTVASLFAFRYVTEYYMNFEQVYLPISLTMIMIGFFLNLLCKPSVIDIVGIAWVGCLCVNAYTPAVASAGLLAVFLGMLSIALLVWPDKLPFQTKSRVESGKLLAAATATIIIFTIACFMGPRSDRITRLQQDISILPQAGMTIFEAFTDRKAVFFGPMLVLVIPYLVLSLAFRFKLSHFLVSLWVLGVFAISNILSGYYTGQGVIFVLHRALATVPILVTGISIAVFGIMRKRGIHGNHFAGVALLAAFLVFGVYNYRQPRQSFRYFDYIQPMKYMLSDMQDTTKEYGRSSLDRFSFVLDTGNPLMTNPRDYFAFFYPNADVYLAADGAYPQDMDPSLPVVIYCDRDEGLAAMLPYGDIEIVRYKNKRYNSEGIWYKVYN